MYTFINYINNNINNRKKKQQQLINKIIKAHPLYIFEMCCEIKIIARYLVHT
jgi:hypothetical protein